eukprot:7223881-Prymnesium_polylepis.1
MKRATRRNALCSKCTGGRDCALNVHSTPRPVAAAVTSLTSSARCTTIALERATARYSCLASRS